LRSQITNYEFKEGDGSEYLYGPSKLGTFVEPLLELGIMDYGHHGWENVGFSGDFHLVSTYGLLWK
jgi:hypothetical protein